MLFRSGGSTAEWRESMIEGSVARSDVDRYMPEAYQRAEEFQALSAYHEIRGKYIDEAAGVLDSDTWDDIEQKTTADMAKLYSKKAINYVESHKNDWINDLPEPARSLERDRAEEMESGTWWDDYRGASPWRPETQQPTKKQSTGQQPTGRRGAGLSQFTRK